MRTILTVLLISFGLNGLAQNPNAFKIYNASGEKINYQKMIKKLSSADVVFFGEIHNCPISHWLELRVAKSLFDADSSNLTIGMEMFEADNQMIVDEYMNGIIYERNFENECKLWPNYQTDYKPILKFAKENNVKFIATNVPRRYAAVVNKRDFKGLDLLSNQAKKYIAPLPIEYDSTVECYANMIENMKMMGHTSATIAKAQAIKDATMAYFISTNIEKGKIFYHINGSYHSDNHQGIIWYLNRYKPNLKILTITTVSQQNIDKLQDENKNLADFIIVVPDDMPTSY